MLEDEEYLEMPQSFLLPKTPEARDAVTIITEPGTSYIFTEIDNSGWDMIQGKAEIEEQLEKIQQIVNDKMSQ